MLKEGSYVQLEILELQARSTNGRGCFNSGVLVLEGQPFQAWE